MTHGGRRRLLLVVLSATALGLPLAAGAQGPEQTRTFDASRDRVWTVARSTLESLGWKVDREERDEGWIVTRSREIEFDEKLAYGKGTKHRLWLTLKEPEPNRTRVGIVRRVWKEERILFGVLVDKEQNVDVIDTSVEKGVLDAIARAL